MTQSRNEGNCLGINSILITVFLHMSNNNFSNNNWMIGVGYVTSACLRVGGGGRIPHFYNLGVTALIREFIGSPLV